MRQKSSEDQNQFTQFAIACAQKVSLTLGAWSENIFKGIKMFVNVTCTTHTQRTHVFKHLQGQNRIWLEI